MQMRMWETTRVPMWSGVESSALHDHVNGRWKNNALHQ